MKYRSSIVVAFIGLVLSGTVTSGCAGQEKFEIENPFPTRQELVQLSAKSAEIETAEEPDVAQVETWELTGPLPEKIGDRAYAPTDGVERAFYGAVGTQGKMLRASDAMHCAAREFGHFVLEHEKLPYESLRTFIFARCGVMTMGNSVQYRIQPGATEADGVALAEKSAEAVQKRASDEKSAIDAGFWRGTKGDRAIFVTTVGRKLVDLQPTPMATAASGEVILQGKILVPDMDHAFGLINRGDFSFERCKTDPSVPMPSFRVACEAATADEIAYFQLMTSTQSSVMARTVLVQLVWPSGELAKVYRSPATRRALAKAKRAVAAEAANAPKPGARAAETSKEQREPNEAQVDSSTTKGKPRPHAVEPEPVVASTGDVAVEAYPTTFISLLNQVRQQAAMEPVAHASKQSTSIQSIIKQYIAANRKDDEETANKIALGVMAGWEVKGDIINAGISSRWISSRDPARLLESMLETPSGRRTLMDPISSQVALGVHEGEAAMSSIVASYAFVPEEHPNRRTKRVIDALDEQRKVFGSRPAKEDPKLRSVARGLAKKLQKGEAGIVEARDHLLARASTRWRKPVYGFAFVTHSLETIDFPKELLAPKNLPMSVVVAPFTRPGLPWSMYTIIVVFPRQPKANIARLEGEGASAVFSQGIVSW